MHASNIIIHACSYNVIINYDLELPFPAIYNLTMYLQYAFPYTFDYNYICNTFDYNYNNESLTIGLQQIWP